MQGTVAEARAVLEDAGAGIPATEDAAKRLLAHSHRLAYGTFAPLLGDRLVTDGPYEPPFPPVWYMQQSLLTRTDMYAPFHTLALACPTCYIAHS